MIPWETLDIAEMPGGGEIKLMRRGEEYSIRLGREELMNSRLSASEEALATLACEKIAGRRKPCVLIGGLGMGFTLRAALGALKADARVVVAELAPAVVAWARGPMAPVFGDSLADPRVEIREGDVGAMIASGRGAYDAILLDVDNGPEAFSRDANDSLYGTKGLHEARAALRSGGVLAVWSAVPDRAFASSLTRAGFAVEEAKVKAHRGRSGPRHIIWLATKGAAKA